MSEDVEAEEKLSVLLKLADRVFTAMTEVDQQMTCPSIDHQENPAERSNKALLALKTALKGMYGDVTEEETRIKCLRVLGKIFSIFYMQLVEGHTGKDRAQIDRYLMTTTPLDELLSLPDQEWFRSVHILQSFRVLKRLRTIMPELVNSTWHPDQENDITKEMTDSTDEYPDTDDNNEAVCVLCRLGFSQGELQTFVGGHPVHPTCLKEQQEESKMILSYSIQCVFCGDGFELGADAEACLFECGHAAHPECFEQQLKTEGAADCPYTPGPGLAGLETPCEQELDQYLPVQAEALYNRSCMLMAANFFH